MTEIIEAVQFNCEASTPITGLYGLIDRTQNTGVWFFIKIGLVIIISRRQFYSCTDLQISFVGCLRIEHPSVCRKPGITNPKGVSTVPCFPIMFIERRTGKIHDRQYHGQRPPGIQSPGGRNVELIRMIDHFTAFFNTLFLFYRTYKMFV